MLPSWGIFCMFEQYNSSCHVFRKHIISMNVKNIIQQGWNHGHIPKTLLHPQQWAKRNDDNGTYIKNKATGCLLVWNRGRSKKFVPLNNTTITPTFSSMPGTFHYRAFEATFMACDASTPQLRHHLSYDNILL